MKSATASGCGGCAKPSLVERTLVVRSAADLQRLLLSISGFDRVVLHESLIMEPRNREVVAARLARLSQECGCTVGGLMFVVALAGCLAATATGIQPTSLRAMWMSLVVCVAATLFGKAIGWGHARWRLRREILRLRLLLGS